MRSPKTACWLGLLAAMALGAFGVTTASATQSGHFTSESPSGRTSFNLLEKTGSEHETTLSAYGMTTTCHDSTYHVHHVSSPTFTTFTVTPTRLGCTTGSGETATVRMNGCSYDFTSRSAPNHATVHLECPVGSKTEIESSGGTVKIGAQTPHCGGVTYSTIEMEGKHAITINLTLECMTAECHGLCQLLGTNTGTAKLTGSLTLQGKDTDTGLVTGITST